MVAGMAGQQGMVAIASISPVPHCWRLSADCFILKSP
jgi:hypothetical protein